MKLTKILLTSALLGASILSFHSTVAAMDFGTQVGIDAYRKNDFAQAAEQFKDAGIVRGDPTAQILLGQMYYNGEFFKQDYVEAAKWYRKAADQGAKFALLFLGEMYDNGVGVKQNKAKAKELFKKSCEQGTKEACKALKSYNKK